MEPSGLSANSRKQLSQLLRDGMSVLTPSVAASTLGITHAAAARRLAAWSRAGWLARVRRGAYVSVPMESASADIALEDPWSVAAAMFSPCYIGGWSAAEHWGLTEQIFGSLCVMTSTRPRNRKLVLRKVRFEIHTVATTNFVGLKTVWRGGARVQVTDPARTVVDMLADPALAGGIRHLSEMLENLLHDQPQEAAKLGMYASKLGIGSIFKRLGFLLQSYHPGQSALIELCRQNLSAGYAKLDPALPADRLVTAWRVWVPAAEVREVQR